MQHNVTIIQTIAKTIEVYADSEKEAIDIGNFILAQNTIPISDYDLMEANVSAEVKNNVIPLNIELQRHTK